MMLAAIFFRPFATQWSISSDPQCVQQLLSCVRLAFLSLSRIDSLNIALDVVLPHWILLLMGLIQKWLCCITVALPLVFHVHILVAPDPYIICIGANFTRLRVLRDRNEEEWVSLIKRKIHTVYCIGVNTCTFYCNYHKLFICHIY